MTVPRRTDSMRTQMLKAAATILVGALLLMLVLGMLPGMPGWRVALVETIVLIIPVAMALHFVVYRARIEESREQGQTAALEQQAERQDQALFAVHPHPMWIFDTETLRFLAVNDAAVAHYGYSRVEFLAMTVADIRPPEDVPALRETLMEERTSQGINVIRARHLKKDGTLFAVEITSHAITFGARPARLARVFDIADRQRAELERQVMHEIAQSVATSANLDELLKLMHHSLQRVFEAENCFVALYDKQTGLFSFPYFVDQHDTLPAPTAMEHSCTAYVFRRGEPVLITPAFARQLHEQHETELVGSPSASWMGVPLRAPSGTIAASWCFSTTRRRTSTASAISRFSPRSETRPPS